MQFELFRLSVVLVEPTLYTADLSRQERRNAILQALEHRPTGRHRNVQYRASNLELLDELDAWMGLLGTPSREDVAIRDEETGDLITTEIAAERWTTFVYLPEEQVIAVMRNSRFFSGSPHGLAHLLEEVVEAGLNLDGYKIAANPLLERSTFEEVLERCAMVIRVRFEMIPPNAFGAGASVRQILEMAKTNLGASRVVHDVSNPQRGLKKDNLAEALSDEANYVNAGGGKWRVQGRDRDGRRVAVRSDQRVVAANVEVEPKSHAEFRSFGIVIVETIRGLVRSITERVRSK